MSISILIHCGIGYSLHTHIKFSLQGERPQIINCVASVNDIYDNKINMAPVLWPQVINRRWNIYSLYRWLRLAISEAQMLNLINPAYTWGEFIVDIYTEESNESYDKIYYRISIGTNFQICQSARQNWLKEKTDIRVWTNPFNKLTVSI